MLTCPIFLYCGYGLQDTAVRPVRVGRFTLFRKYTKSINSPMILIFLFLDIIVQFFVLKETSNLESHSRLMLRR